MFWIILIALLIIAAIAYGLGVSFWAVVGILAALAVIFFVGCGLLPDEEDSPEKAKKKKIISKVLLISVPVVLVILIIGAIIGGVESNSSSESRADAEYDDMMAGYDWGDDYYYDSNDNAVKEKPW